MLVNNQSRVLHRYISDSFKRKHSFQGRLKTMVSFAGVVLRRVLLRKPRHYILFKTGISIPSACMWWRTLALGRQRSRSFLSPFLKAVQRCRPWVAAFTHDFQDWAYSIIHIHFFLSLHVYIWMMELGRPRTVLILFVKRRMVSRWNPIYHRGWSCYWAFCTRHPSTVYSGRCFVASHRTYIHITWTDHSLSLFTSFFTHQVNVVQSSDMVWHVYIYIYCAVMVCKFFIYIYIT